MNFNKLINNVLEEDLSKEDRLKALKNLKAAKQYVLFNITGTYSHTPETIIDSFGQKRTSQNAGVKTLKFEDYFNTSSLYNYKETVYIPFDLMKERYVNSKEALKGWLDQIQADDIDRLYIINNPSKDMVIAGIEYNEKDHGSKLDIAFPLEQKELLDTLLKGIKRDYKEFVGRIEEEQANANLWTNSNLHLAEYFLNLPGNQKLY